jgi:phosphate-selective porin
VLAGWNPGGAWQPALRVDWFRVHQLPDTLDAPLGEHGNALTAAINWRPHDRWRITGELLRIDSTRTQRLQEGRKPRQVDVQAQLSLRWFF